MNSEHHHDDPGEALDRQARALQYNHPGLSYQKALDRVMALAENQSLVQTYADPSYQPNKVHAYAGDHQQAPEFSNESNLSAEIDGRVKDHMKATGSKDYAASFRWVLGRNEELRKAYGEVWK